MGGLILAERGRPGLAAFFTESLAQAKKKQK